MRDWGKLSVSWFVLEDGGRAIGEFIVDVVPVLPLPTGQEAYPFYPKPKIVRRRAKRARVAAPDRDAEPDRLPLGDGEVGDGEGSDSTEGSEGVVDRAYVEDAEDEIDELLHDVAEILHAPVDPEMPGEAPAAPAAPEGPEPPPLPPPLLPPPQQAARRRGARGSASVSVFLPYGTIRFYEDGRFQATCANKNHGNCVLTRGNRTYAMGAADALAGGRPVGFMIAWLFNGSVDDKSQHWSEDLMAASHDQRRMLREALADTAEGRDLLSKERGVIGDEPEEPLDVLPYVRPRRGG